MAIQVLDDIPQGRLKFGIFDFDNGIVDTESVFAQFDCDLLNAVLREAGLTADLKPEDIRKLAGNGGDEKLKIIAARKGFNASDFSEAFNASRTEQRKTLFHEHRVTIAPGLHDLLDHLGERRALATNKKAAKLLPDLDAMGLQNLFNVIITSDGMNKKPAPDVILAAMEQLSALPQQCVYFGDNIVDIQAALAANVIAIGFIIEGLKGHEARITAMRNAGAHAVTDTYSDVIKYFK